VVTASLRKRVQKLRKSNSLKCHVYPDLTCSATFAELTLCQSHFRETHFMKKRFTYAVCNVLYCRKSSLNKHIELAHSQVSRAP